VYLGIEIGGTKLQLGVGCGDGRPLVALARRSVVAGEGARRILDQIAEAGAALLAAHPIRRIGIGFGGPVNAAEGVVLKSHQVSGWDGFPLVQWCREKFGLPAKLGNDCDVAALAEALWGAGRGKASVLYVTVGTGIGGGIVLGGRLFGAGRPAVAEIGHLRPGLDAEAADQTVESLASGPAIARIAAAFAREAEGEADAEDLRQRAAGDLSQLTAREVAQAARLGNRLARQALDRACRVLGWAIGQAATLLAPEVVIVGGGVSLIGEEPFFGPVRSYARRYVFPPLAEALQIVPAALGEEVVVHGALALAAQDDGEGSLRLGTAACECGPDA
jgi:glucokinase